MFGAMNLFNIIASVFILIAVALLLLTIVVLVIWMWRGDDGVLFPGLGLIVSTPVFIISLLILAIVSVAIAGVVKPKKPAFNSAEAAQNFEYPSDIFSGCGNGVLDLSLAKNPDKYDSTTDRALKICINYEDLFAIQDAVVSGRIDYQNIHHNEEYEKADENNRKVFQKFASLYPMLARINDMYQDYVFTPDEIQKLREECLKLQSAKQNAAADLALRKLIYSCEEALKDNSYLMFSSD